jgi:hypothetical protein
LATGKRKQAKENSKRKRKEQRETSMGHGDRQSNDQSNGPKQRIRAKNQSKESEQLAKQ